MLVAVLTAAGCPGNLAFQYMPANSDDAGTGGVGGTDAGGGRDAGAGTGGGGGTSVPTSCANATTVLGNNCVPCHTNPPSLIYANLDLLSPGFAQRLVGKPAYTGASGSCGGMGNLLNPTTLPATGILIDKINFVQTCGVGMPATSSVPMSAGDVSCLQAWANGLVAGVGN
jgi:hypothetical protein